MKRCYLLFVLFIASWTNANADVVLPNTLTIIEEAAFQGDISVKEVVIHDQVTEICNRAFADTGLEHIVIPASVTNIASDAFANIVTPMLIETQPDSVVVTFALQNNIDFRANTVCRALLIGQTDYPGDYKLEGPGKDITKLSGALDNYLVTAKTNLTADEILDAVSTTFAEAKEQDISLLYYSGHGERTTGALVGIDMAGNVTAERLREALDEIPGRKVVIVDACYSGALIGRSLLRSSAEDPAALFVEGFKTRSRSRSSNLVEHRNYVMASSKGDEESWEASYGGVFSNALISSKTLGDANQDDVVTFEEAYQYTKTKVNSIVTVEGKTQTVQVYPENCYWFGLFR